VHLNFEGNELVARTVAAAMLPLLPNSIARADTGAWPVPALCARRLALTDWDRCRVLENVLHRLAEPPFTRQSNHQHQLRAIRDAIAAARARCNAESAREARVVYQDAMQAAPGDFYLRSGFAKLLEDTGDLTGAIPEWERARDLIPFAPGPYFYLGKLLARVGRDADALQQLSRALEIRPDIPDALLEKAQLLLKQKKAQAALNLLEAAAQLQPANARLCVRRAEALAALQRRVEAVAQLREAVRLRPDFGEARYLLGVELAVDGNVREAAEQFQEVIRLNPDFALGHLNFGIALAKLGRVSDATAQFRETLRLEPGNRKAAENLAQLEKGSRRQP
jgi:tetratricopeptide (TPR) repeat protein